VGAISSRIVHIAAEEYFDAGRSSKRIVLYTEDYFR
jgi:hypothetical protein